MPRGKKQNGSGVVNVNSEALIQRIIAQRRAEVKDRAEQRRQRDLRRIQEMRSKTGIEPLDIFPQELWESILDKLGSMDKGNISEVHELFQNLMKNTRIRDILFPQIIGMSVCDGSPSPASYKNLRGVSKTLREEVDRYYESYLLNLMRTDTETRVNCISLDLWTRKEEQENKPKRFFTRSLSMHLPLSKIQFDRRKNGIYKMLEQIGDQVLCLHFCWYDDSYYIREDPKMSIGQSYIEFNKFLEYMPNLKWLRLELWLSPQEQNSFKNALQDMPPKKLENLERIDYGSQWDNPETIEFFEAVLKANFQIKILNLRGLQAPISNTVVRSLPNLEVIVPWRSWESPSSSTSLDCMRRNLNENWPLKRLELKGPASSLNSMFRFLEKFPTLEHLWLGLSNVSFEREVTYLRLPNLKKLEMYVPPHNEICLRSRGAFFFFSLQFLLYATKLNSLTWTDKSVYLNNIIAYLERETASVNGIDFCGGWRTFTKSNVWEVFPDLDHVEISCFHGGAAHDPQIVTREYRRHTLVRKRYHAMNAAPQQVTTW